MVLPLTKGSGMKKMRQYTIFILLTSLLIISIGTTTAVVSCTADMPEKLLPAYYLDIRFPAGEPVSTLTTTRGNSVFVPVIMTSNSEVPISIRLTRDDRRVLPDFITFESRTDFITLQPGENTTLYVTFNVSELAIPGSYDTGIHGELKEPVANRSLITQVFNLFVTDH
jgi:hypothetical protein